MTFKTELAEIEKEITLSYSEENINLLEGRKSQLIHDQEIHEKIMKEFVEKLRREFKDYELYNLNEIKYHIDKLYEEIEK